MLARAVGSCRRRRVPGAVARIGRTCGGTSSCLSRRLVRRLLRLVRPLLRLVRRPLRLVRRLLRLVRRRATRRRPLSRSSGRREWLRGRRRPATRRPLRHDEPASSARRRPGRVVQRTTWTPHRIPNLGVLESLSLRAYRRPGHPASPRCGAAGDPSLGASLVRGPRVLWSRAVRPVGRRPLGASVTTVVSASGIEVDAVVPDFGSTRALDQVTFEVRPGRMTGFVGASTRFTAPSAAKPTGLRISAASASSINTRPTVSVSWSSGPAGPRRHKRCYARRSGEDPGTS